MDIKKLISLLLCASTSWGAWTFKTSQSGCSVGGSANVSVVLDTTGADLIVCSPSAFNRVPAGTVTDSVGGNSNTFTCKTGQSTSPYGGTKICYAANPSFTGSDTITYNTVSGDFPAFVCEAFSGSQRSPDPFDGENGTAFASGTSVNAGSITPSTANDLFVTAIATDGTNFDAATVSGFTLPSNGRQVYSAGNCEAAQLWYLAPGTSGAQNPAWSWLSSKGGGVVDAAFVAAATATSNGNMLEVFE